MSADNWRDCPACLKKHNKEKAASIAAVRMMYGKIDADDFVKRLAEAESADIPETDTLREDYSLGIRDDGSFIASYRGECQACGSSFSFKEEKPTTDFSKAAE